MMVAGVNSLAILIAPYSAYGRIASSLFAPVWQLGNNLLAYFAERMNSYAFYEVDVLSLIHISFSLKKNPGCMPMT